MSEINYVSFVVETLAEFGLNAGDVALEVTEQVVIDDRSEAVLTTLDELGRIGVRLIIDDFGTGYSALSSLRRVPFAGFKIDRCFIDEVGTLDAPAPIFGP